MRIALAQINTTVGDLAGNAGKMVRFSRQAAEGGAQIVVFTELSLTGYPPRDLVEKPIFLLLAEEELNRLAAEISTFGITAICGTVEHSPNSTGKRVINSAAVLTRGSIVFALLSSGRQPDATRCRG